MSEETCRLASYLCGIKYAELDSDTVDAAKKCIEDFIGVAIAGSAKKESEIWKKYYSERKSLSESHTFQLGFQQMEVEQAAALNAVFGHVMDMDDVHNASIVHLGVITVPTAVALGEKLHKSGTDVIESVVAGYEAGARIGEAINPSSYKYWHTTGVVGPFAAGATAAKLLNLNEEQMLNCLGSAGTQAAGLWEFLESGAMSKVLHTANGNLCGIRAAKLAGLGFTGSPTILEGKRGFVRALAAEFNLTRLTEGYGRKYCILENSFKPYACCRHTHSANYCIEKILEKNNFSIDDIAAIIDETYSTAVQTTNDPDPENAYAAKFSVQFCIAAMLVLHDLSDSVFTPENVADPRIRKLMSKITVKMDPELDREFHDDPTQWSHRITIALKDGRTITERVDFPLGDAKNAFSWDMEDRKFRRLTEKLSSSERENLLDKLHSLEKLDDVSALFK